MNQLPTGRILHGDCSQLMKQLPDNCIDLILASPPYGTIRKYGGHKFDPVAVINQLWRITKPGGIVAWVVQDTVNSERSLSGDSYEQALYFRRAGWRWHDEITLVRSGRQFPGSQRRYGPCEKAFIFSKGRPTTINLLRDRPNKRAGKRIRCTMRRNDQLKCLDQNQEIKDFGCRLGWWEYAVGGRPKDMVGDHPSRMDDRIATDLIKSYSNKGDVVLDPMAGSGTTCKAAYLFRRKFIGMEIHEPYAINARKRLRNVRNELLQKKNVTVPTVNTTQGSATLALPG